MRLRAILPILLPLVGCATGGNKDNTRPGDNLPPNDSGTSFDVGGPGPGFDAAIDTTPPDPTVDPKTCDEAATRHTYVGCDYWPTVVANNVWSVFDFAAVVANAGDQPAEVSVTGPNGVDVKVTVAPNALQKIFLPWVKDLKGPDFDACAATGLPASVFSKGGAYHLVSTRPVTVYQFNALEYQGSGGPPGKSWAACPPPGYCKAGKLDCYSFSNDASLLLPSTAITGNYWITGTNGWTDTDTAHTPVSNSYFAITATADGTHVKVKVAAKGKIIAGTGVTATAAGGILELDMNAGDVAELACSIGSDCDPSGSQVQASKPVQIITGMPCTNIPNNLPYCDHIEQSVFPAETFGKKYFVTVPTAPRSNIVGHVVRFYGSVDGTKLSYAPSKPACHPVTGQCPPDTLNAGEFVEVPINVDFEVIGDQPFAVGSFMIGAANLDPSTAPPKQEGDPSQSNVAAVEQYRKKYVFLTPDDYDVAFLDMVAPTGTQIFMDGKPIGTYVWNKTIADGMSALRVRLDQSQEGAHVLTAEAQFGLQVIGYGAYTSYYYPGGLNLDAIAPAPPPIK